MSCWIMVTEEDYAEKWQRTCRSLQTRGSDFNLFLKSWRFFWIFGSIRTTTFDPTGENSSALMRTSGLWDFLEEKRNAVASHLLYIRLIQDEILTLRWPLYSPDLSLLHPVCILRFAATTPLNIGAKTGVSSIILESASETDDLQCTCELMTEAPSFS